MSYSSVRSFFLLTRSGGYESGFAGRGWGGGPVPQRSNLEDVVFFLFGAHGENCRRDDHSEKYQCKNEIVDHWGGSPCGRLWPSLSNLATGNEKGTSHLGAMDCDGSCRLGVFCMFSGKVGWWVRRGDDRSGFQPSVRSGLNTWGFAPGWYRARLWRLSRARLSGVCPLALLGCKLFLGGFEDGGGAVESFG